MNTFYSWITSALTILALALIMPGVSVIGFTPALESALIFGGMARMVRHILRYFGIPERAFYLSIMSALVYGAFVVWTTALVPGFLIGDWAAFLFVAALTAANVYLINNEAKVANIANMATNFVAYWLRRARNLFKPADNALSLKSLIFKS